MAPDPSRFLALALLAALPGCRPAPGDPEFGVSATLARTRAETISDLHYELQLTVPGDQTAPVTGTVAIRFALSALRSPLVLDFRGDSTSIADVTANGSSVAPLLSPGHVIIPAEALVQGENTVTLTFAAGDEALNRNDGFLYALFVPDRASTAFPSFDQPDLKARYQLQLTVPAGWHGLSNGPELSRDSSATGVTLSFGQTEPISSYLFTFAAGLFQVEQAVRDGRALTMFHRETDSAKVARNRNAIFDLHATALRWLEEYTGIGYPFGKFAFLAVPSFQFGGMEHPGAIWYRSSSLFLDPTATRNQILSRASLIAHETAHMWFGDLVTMRWFSDVWMKEVFANFMAARIVEPSFPEVNHQLRFLLAHHPTAYGVDRTVGANPIRQELENLRGAGSLYGAIIYQKAPIVMRQLEQLTGPDTFQQGLRIYLDRFRFGNATWPDLIAILDDLSPEDLAGWSRAWVEQPFRPTITVGWTADSLTVTQSDPRADRGLRWTQAITVALGYPDTILTVPVRLTGATVSAASPRPDRPAWILPSADGLSYGRFVLDSTSRVGLMARLPEIADPVVRSSAWLALWESVLGGGTPPGGFLDLSLRALESEPDDLVTQHVLGRLTTTYWRLLSAPARLAVAPRVEAALWRGLGQAEGASRKGAWWGSLVSVTQTSEGTRRLYRIWRGDERVPGLPLAEPQYIALAEALAIRGVPETGAMLDAQAAKLTNPDRRARFEFVRPSLSGSPTVRDSVFASLGRVENRRRESWALDALGYLNHPLHAGESEHYIAPGLALLEEIQRTGDIFFPLGWLNSLLDGHQSGTAADLVAGFLTTRTELPPQLRGKLLQAADDLFRSARIVSGWAGGPVLEGEGPGG